ncbi:uroporphyrinogen-III C-methyltransferase [Undibacter mobilis]|uniref:Uroporphyrinogen-III C-methyltransferase n=2 Tax=Undibacter mobilis TaxID=2292256 RepID=A0A371BDU9_9BRAD|nr:uroporphyrinogen-III C-methyltransferase [Undibacter mobilis]
MTKLSRLPVFFALSGKRVVLVGGSHAAAWKAELMSAAGARVEVFAEAFSDEMRAVALDPPDGEIVLIERAWTPDDVYGAAIAIGAFEVDEGAAVFAQAARAHGIPVNVIDKPAFCDFSFGAIVNRSPLVIGISTDGAAPVFAQAIRAKLEALLPNGFTDWAAAASRWRDKVKASGLSFTGRRKFWQVFTAHAVTHAETLPSESDFDRFVAEVKGLGAAVESGTVTLVGAGPGDPELLTLRAVRALQSADVILFDDLVSRGVLDFARREARKLLVGKTGFGPSCKQDDINTLMLSLAKQGKRVVRLKGGDPLIFGRAGEELDACNAAGIRAEIVPGITAAQGAAASLGLSLTDRKHARRLQYITGHAQSGQLPDDIDWQALADPVTTTAIYMPVRTLDSLVSRALAAGLDPQTPAVAIARATRPDQQVIRSGISDLPALIAAAKLPGPVIVMLGRAFARQAAPASRIAAQA